MHDFVLREAEVGTRVAMAEDEDAVMGADFRLLVLGLAEGVANCIEADDDEDGWF
jgi:hypothetical protein